MLRYVNKPFIIIIYTENIAVTRKAQRKGESIGKYCVAGGSRRSKLQE
jgi:hypothetical protein